MYVSYGERKREMERDRDEKGRKKGATVAAGVASHMIMNLA